MKNILIFLNSLAGLLVSLTYSTFIWGFITFKFYNWFFIEKFDDMPIVTINFFIGLSLFIQALFPKQLITKPKDEYLDIDFEVLHHYITPWIIFLFGFCYHKLFF
jgi:hypothetical protein